MIAKKRKRQSDDTVKIVAGASLVIGALFSILGTFFTIVDWQLARKIILAAVLIIIWLIVEIVFWNRTKTGAARRKLPRLLDLFVEVQKELDPETKQLLRKALIRRIFRLAFQSILAAILVGILFSFGEERLGLALNPPTATATLTQTSTPSEAPTITRSPTATITPSLTQPPPASKSLYYMIVIDASANMNESFDGRSKWNAALESINIILDGLNENAGYGLVVIGGSEDDAVLNPCREPAVLRMASTSREEVRDHINELEPGGGGSFYNGFTLAKNHLENLSADRIRTLIYITGSSDSCEGRDEWSDLERIIPFVESIEIHGEIIILDETRGLQIQDIADRLDGLSENVNVQAPQDISALQQSFAAVINNITIYVNNEIEGSGSPGTDSGAPPGPRPTNTPIVLAPAPQPITQVVLVTPTSILPTAVPPTFPGTLPPHVSIPLPPQPEVFSPSCFLRNHATAYARFYQGQAGISAELVAGGNTDQGVRLDFSNVSYEGANYAGWEVWLGANNQAGIDLSQYTNLVFYIRGRDGGEEPNVYLMMPVTTDYWRYWKDVELITPVTKTWQRVAIPLSHFASSQAPHQQVNLNNIKRIQILFEWYPQPRSGRIFIDDLCVE